MLERRAEGHIYAFCLRQIVFALPLVPVRRTPLPLLDVRASLLLGCVALPFQSPNRVIFYLVVELDLEFFVVAEVSHRAHRNVVNLVQAIGNELVLVVIGALQ